MSYAYQGPYTSGAELPNAEEKRTSFPRTHTWEGQNYDLGATQEPANPDYNKERQRDANGNHQGGYATDGDYEAQDVEKVRRRQVMHRCVCISSVAVIGLGALVGVLVLILFLVYQPTSPSVTIQTAGVDSFSLSNTTTTTKSNKTSVAYTLDAVVSLQVQVKNPNKIAIEFGSVNATMSYKATELAFDVVPGFSTPAHTKGLVDFKFTIKKADLGKAGKEFSKDVAKGSVTLTVHGKVTAHIKVAGVATPAKDNKLNCKIAIDPSKPKVISRSCSI